MPNDRVLSLLERIKNQAKVVPDTTVVPSFTDPTPSSSYKLPKKLFLQNEGLDDRDLTALIQFLHEDVEDCEIRLVDGTKARKRWGDELEELNLGNLDDKTNPNAFCDIKIISEPSAKYGKPGLAKLKILNLQSTGVECLELALTNLTQLDASNNKIRRFIAETPKLGSCILNHNLLEHIDVSVYKKLHTLYINSNKLRYLRLGNPKLSDLFMLDNPLATLALNDSEPIMILCDLTKLDNISRARLSRICKKIPSTQNQVNIEQVDEDNNPEQRDVQEGSNQAIEDAANEEPNDQDISEAGTIILDYQPNGNITQTEAWSECSLVRKRHILSQIHINNLKEQAVYEHLYNCLRSYIKQQVFKDVLSICSIYKYLNAMHRTKEQAQTTDKGLNMAANIIKELPTEIGLKILCSYVYGEQIIGELNKTIDGLNDEIKNGLQIEINPQDVKIGSSRIVNEAQCRVFKASLKLSQQVIAYDGHRNTSTNGKNNNLLFAFKRDNSQSEQIPLSTKNICTM